MIYDYKVKDTNGETTSLDNYKGKVLLVVNTATGCGFTPQYEGLQKLYDKYKDKGFEIISISIDEKKTDWDKAMKEEKMVWKQLCDPNGFNGPVAQKYNITGVPTCILLDKEGRIFKTEMRGAALDAVLQELY